MSITQAILKLRIEYAKRFRINPTQINGGMCMDFAREIAEQGFGEDVWGSEISIIYWTGAIQIMNDAEFEYFADYHCFIEYKGKFYDSETPQGCDYPDQLLCYQRNIDSFAIEYVEAIL